MKRKQIKWLIFRVTIYCIIYITIISLPLNEELLKTFFPVVNRQLYSLITLIWIFLWFENVLQKRVATFLSLEISYGIFLFITLFLRTNYQYSLFIKEFYLQKWLKYFLTNQIVFINVLGNVILFLPLGYIMVKQIHVTKIMNFIIGLGFILIIEGLQFVTKTGIADYVDVFLNSIGLMVGITFTEEGEKNNE